MSLSVSSPTARAPVLGFAAFSGTGKTTLLTRLLPLLKAKGVRVGLVKHAHHSFEIDTPGKDSYALRQAGANPVLIASRRRWALMQETPDSDEPRLDELVERVRSSSPDLVLVEGFKHGRFAKIELHRPSLARPLLFPDDENILAIATDAPLSPPPPIPVLDLNDAEQLAAFVMDYARHPRAPAESGRARKAP